jgi:hypothetical protein
MDVNCVLFIEVTKRLSFASRFLFWRIEWSHLQSLAHNIFEQLASIFGEHFIGFPNHAFQEWNLRASIASACF